MSPPCLPLSPWRDSPVVMDRVRRGDWQLLEAVRRGCRTGSVGRDGEGHITFMSTPLTTNCLYCEHQTYTNAHAVVVAR